MSSSVPLRLARVAPLGLIAALALGGCETGGPPAIRLALVADGNRSGAIEVDDPGEDTSAGWDATRGAVLLVNLDDDDRDGVIDASDERINGAADLDDLSPLVLPPWIDAPDSAQVRLELDQQDAGTAGLFRLRAGADPARVDGWQRVKLPLVLDGASLREGVTFAVEGTTLVTSTATGAFDGRVRFHAALDADTARAFGAATPPTATATLRVAPVLFQYNTAHATRVLYTADDGDTQSLADGIQPVADRTGATLEGIDPRKFGGDDDVWMQDFIDFGVMTKPAPGGGVHAIRVAIKSAQGQRPAGHIAQRVFFGPDFAALAIASERSPSDESWSMSSFGNWDVVPPYEHAGRRFPLGRNVWGATGDPKTSPDRDYADFVRAQRVQPEINLDTSWLFVGHVDEFTSFVKASTARGFQLLVADPGRARAMLQSASQAGHGGVPLFADRKTYDWDTYDEIPAAKAVDATLADPDLMAQSQLAAAHIDENLAHLVAEIGLSDDEIVPMPFLFENAFDTALAWIPGTVNLLHLDGQLVIPDPFGPQIDGQDLFKADLVARLAARGLVANYADDWYTYHLEAGEVHCGSNVIRELPGRWWEGGR